MLLDGRGMADDVKRSLAEAISQLTGRPPCLAVVLVGNHPASQLYVKRKAVACRSIGIRSLTHSLPHDISEKALLSEIARLNECDEVDGILVQLPLPAHISPMRVFHTLNPLKDVDGFHPLNVGKLCLGDSTGFSPCTPLGIQMLLMRTGIEIEGRHVVIVGRSNLVGKPLALLLMQQGKGGNATVTVVHRHSRDLPTLCRSADILVVAVGQPGLVTADMIREGCVVIDVGINAIPIPGESQKNRLVGDVDFDSVAPKCTWITPVPGGVGPMTIAMLLQNTFTSYRRRYQLL